MPSAYNNCTDIFVWRLKKIYQAIKLVTSKSTDNMDNDQLLAIIAVLWAGTSYCRAPFFEGYKFYKCTKRKLEETIFTNLHSLQSAIHVTIGFLLTFSEIDFVEV